MICGTDIFLLRNHKPNQWEPDPRRAFAFSSVYARANSKTSLKTENS